MYEQNGRREMIVYGGMNGNRLGDVHVLDLDQMEWRHQYVRLFPLFANLCTCSVSELHHFLAHCIQQTLFNTRCLSMVDGYLWNHPMKNHTMILNGSALALLVFST